MSKIVSEPKPRNVTCNACTATIEYFPEDVLPRKVYVDHGDLSTSPDRVKCPRERCPGYGIIGSRR